MQRGSILALLLAGLGAANVAPAQTPWSGRLAIYDDAAMTQAFGVMTEATKSIYVGMPVEGTLGGYATGYEFSISGLDAFDAYTLYFPITPVAVIGNVVAPTDTISGTGGLNVAWPLCHPRGQAFLEIRLFEPEPPLNHVLQVHRRFPPTNPQFPYPRAASCDSPCFCTFILRGESYVLNPTVRTEAAAWTAIKRLYR